MVDWSSVATNIVAAGGGGAAVAFAIFRGLGAKWIDNHFANQLGKSRHDHALETERLKFRIAELLDRTTKLNQREFEILPDIWEKATKAYQELSYLIHPFRQHPDFTRLEEEKFDEWLENVDLLGTVKNDLKAAGRHQRNSIYSEAMKWKELNSAQRSINEFGAALANSSIYLHPDTHERLTKFRMQVYDATHDAAFNLQYPREGGQPREPDDCDAFRKHGREWFESLGDFLRNRYWNKDKLTGH